MVYNDETFAPFLAEDESEIPEKTEAPETTPESEKEEEGGESLE